MTRRVVITGLGIVSCLGNSAEEVVDSLREGKSGISIRQEQIDMGMRSHVAGAPKINVSELIDRKVLRFMGDAAAYAYISMQQAIEDAGLTDIDIEVGEQPSAGAAELPRTFIAVATRPE